MTDAELAAKVRAAAESAASSPMNSEAIAGRVALAMVEQWEWHRDEREACLSATRDTVTNVDLRLACQAAAATHLAAMDRIAAALRKAVGP